MAVALTSITPPRGRSADSVVIVGSGFNATQGNNTVTFNGVSGTITGIVGTTELTVTVPGGLGVDDRQVAVVVTNTGDATSATRYWFVMKSEASYLTHYIQPQQPGPAESISTEVDTIPEAKDYERLVAFVEALRRDKGGSSIPNTSCGAARIGTEADAFARMAPASDHAQAVLEALYTHDHPPAYQVLAGNLTLVAGSKRVQMFDCAEVARVVTLPGATVSPGWFVLMNVGNVGTATVKDASSFVLGTIPARSMAMVFTDGATAWVMSATTGFQSDTLGYGTQLIFGGLSLAAGNYMVVGGAARTSGGTTDATLNQDSEVIVTQAGVVKNVCGLTTAATSSQTLKTWKNGAVADTITFTPVAVASENQFTSSDVSSPVSFAAGDKMAVEFDAGTASQNWLVQVLFVPTAAADARVRCGWWGTSSGFTALQFCTTNNNTTQGDAGTTANEVHAPVPFATTLRRIVWNSATADSTSKVDIFKNNAAVESAVLLSGASGTLTRSDALAAGDAIGVRCSNPAGTATGAVMFSAEVDGIGQLYDFGGQGSAGASEFLLAMGRGTNVADARSNSSTETTRFICAKAGRVKAVGWYRSSSTSADVELWKNGALDQDIVFGSSTRGAVTPTETEFVRGDRIEINDDDTTNPGDIVLSVYIAPAIVG